jgi:hypothetical protein
LADGLNDRSDRVGAIYEFFSAQFATEFKRVIHHALLYHAKVRNANRAGLMERKRDDRRASGGPERRA